MPFTLQDQLLESGRRDMGCKSAGGLGTSRGTVAAVAPARRMPARVEKLLGPDPVDLTQVCDEIRRTPGLEAMALRLVVSLSLSDDDSLHTIEKAAIALGTSRLKALFQGWTMLLAKELPGSTPPDPAAESSLATIAADRTGQCTPESLYLAGFLRILGLDSPSVASGLDRAHWVAASGEGESYSSLTEIFIRDFISLIPNLGVSAVVPEVVTASAGRHS